MRLADIHPLYNCRTYSSRDFLLEISVEGQDFAESSSSTIQGSLAAIEILADGTTFTVRGVFNDIAIGVGEYRKEGRDLVVISEQGALVGVFSPLPRIKVSGPPCAKCGSSIEGEPATLPSWDGTLCGECAWAEWLIVHE
jgi:hypothetical protein